MFCRRKTHCHGEKIDREKRGAKILPGKYAVYPRNVYVRNSPNIMKEKIRNISENKILEKTSYLSCTHFEIYSFSDAIYLRMENDGKLRSYKNKPRFIITY